MEFVNSATFQVTPGEALPSEGPGLPTVVPTGYPAPSPTSTPAAASPGDDHRLGPGQIAGIAIGAAALLVLAAALIYICGRQSRGDKRRAEVRESFPAPAGAMVDTKYASSPGHGSFRAPTAYSNAPSHDPYAPSHPSPPLHQHPAVSGTSLPGSPGAHPTYSSYQSLGMLQSPNGVQTGFYHGQAHTPPAQQPLPPVELPTSVDPGNSPIPPYSARQMSWGAGAEADYRPGGKTPR